MSLEIRHLRLVAAIAEEGGVTRAGTRLHLTQSALSHQLRDVEERLGAPLFQRLNKKMVLTPAGERLLRTARTVLEDVRQAEDDIRRASAGCQGVLRIATQCYTNYHWLPGRLKLFHKQHPRVDVEVVVEATAQPIEALIEGKLDLAIVNCEVRDRRIALQPLFPAEFVVVMAPGHRLAARPYVRPEDFADETFFMYSTLDNNTPFQDVLRPAGIVPRRAVRVQLTEAIVEMVKAGIGVAVLARWAVAPQIASGAIEARPLTRRGFCKTWSAATLRSRSTPAYVRDFIALLAEAPALRQPALLRAAGRR